QPIAGSLERAAWSGQPRAGSQERYPRMFNRAVFNVSSQNSHGNLAFSCRFKSFILALKFHRFHARMKECKSERTQSHNPGWNDWAGIMSSASAACTYSQTGSPGFDNVPAHADHRPLLIKGIRSFSPENVNVVEFFRPLTLIVGQNGAGKTTIIECLKQACTGALPPNTRSGQSFIHDPKVAHETEVKGQIKLRFVTSSGQPVVVVRSFSLTQKKAQMQFKTLDSVLQTVNAVTGEKQVSTYRCIDIDKMVPQLMGVSKAVLENVIFVHQEDSNWPLSEGKVLKDKFDDIFSATKYSKALESLRVLHKERVTECKQKKLKLETVRTLRDQAGKLQEEMARATEAMEAHAAQITQLNASIQEQSSVVSGLEVSVQRLAQLRQQAELCAARLEELDKQAASKRAVLQVASAPLSSLSSDIA
ncbi:DNA repair protein RAD50, partial [Haematococcus lacustris]